MNTPFPYETYAENEEFYGRDDEIKEILKYTETANNVVMYSKRRLGKSSLIKEVYRQNQKDYHFVYCDVFDIVTKTDFANNLLKGLSSSIKPSTNLAAYAKKIKGLFKRITVDVSLDPATGIPTAKPNTNALSFEEMIEEFFSTLFTLSQSKNVVLCIDGFQEILTIDDVKIDAILRKYMQENKQVSYIFVGSKRHMLSGLFEYRAPLFEMASPITFTPLDLKYVYEYAVSHLPKLSKEIAEYIYELSDGETKLMQHIFHILYQAHRKKEITEELVDEAKEEILNSKTGAYKIIFDGFTNNQKKTFKALAKYDKNLFQNTVLKEFAISKSAMQKVLDTLFTRELIDKEDDIWFIPDRSLELWGKRLTQ